MTYTPREWTNDSTPAINAANLNRMENGIVNSYKHLIGFVAYYCKDTAPEGWLVCDGSPISRTTYKDLFNVIGTTFGKGNGSTTFNLPDLRGEFIRGWSNNRTGVDSERVFGSSQNGSAFVKDVDDDWIRMDSVSTFEKEGDSYGEFDMSKSSSSSGGGKYTIRPRNVALLPCIFAGNNIKTE